ncbi:hypothetical protein [Streptomyces sp. TLI_171]|uniref:hypothetical protein n=1 Tax=Streptomyces sp. TLI_171 TaxID=1938859 RepID=UPI000C499B41|nr:hypothetical protein [Streptomyces sp. TLI_171]RKE22600.1 hypothetical protein BX266_6047 [Streptomyces sp. TLI_171]
MGESDGRMRLRLTSHRVAGHGLRLGRVLSAGPMLRNTLLHPPRPQVGVLSANRADLLRLGALFRLAATSPHSAVHVPAPPGAPAQSFGYVDNPAVPLLLAREDTGLRPSDWPDVRRRMRRDAAPLTVTAPAPRSIDRPADVRRRADHRPARFTEHAGTAVITARPELLFWMGDWLTAGGDAVARDRDIHRHGQTLVADLAGFFDPLNTDDPMHALCVMAVDPIFHKARWHKRRRLREEAAAPRT